MNRSEPAARCYAEALLALAKEKGRLGAALEELRAVEGVFHAEKRVWGLFTSPRIDRAEKEQVVRKAFAGRVGSEVLGLLVVLIRKGREYLYDNIVDQFDRFKDVEQKRVHVFVRSARGVVPEIRAAIEAAVAEATGKTPVLHEGTDPALLGGLTVRVGDAFVDGSVRSRLLRLGRGLFETRLGN